MGFNNTATTTCIFCQNVQLEDEEAYFERQLQWTKSQYLLALNASPFSSLVIERGGEATTRSVDSSVVYPSSEIEYELEVCYEHDDRSTRDLGGRIRHPDNYMEIAVCTKRFGGNSRLFGYMVSDGCPESLNAPNIVLTL
ncbi:hypothetical protein BYT27DRAFT_7261728 [Phlegmacium glaucopus]|nr:hypothetical protein BYT27DRAFT_7261728 [Phlegmacium glaucopus]